MKGAEPAGPRLAVVVPAYRSSRTVGAVLAGIPAAVRDVVVVPTRRRRRPSRAVADPRVVLLRHRRNAGVGGAVRTGYAKALELGADVVVKVDADGQMDPAEVERVAGPALRGEADYPKGNRFLAGFLSRRMPPVRIAGNLVLTFLTKAASGSWDVFDPTNGFTAVHAAVLRRLDPERLARDYFFEISVLLELRRLRARVVDVPVATRYGEERSSLSVLAATATLAAGLVRRLGRQYYLHDVTAASVLALLGGPLLAFGVVWGVAQWVRHARAGELASAETVLLAAVPVILGVQLLLQALALDVHSAPAAPVHPRLADAPAPPPERSLAGDLPRHPERLLPAAGARSR